MIIISKNRFIGKSFFKDLKYFQCVCLRMADLNAFSEFQNSLLFWSQLSFRFENFRKSSILGGVGSHYFSNSGRKIEKKGLLA